MTLNEIKEDLEQGLINSMDATERVIGLRLNRQTINLYIQLRNYKAVGADIEALLFEKLLTQEELQVGFDRDLI